MRRREFIAGLGGAAAWPLVVRAQQSAMPVIGFVHLGSADQYAIYVAAFRRGLKQTGHSEGQNVAIEFRWAEGRTDRLNELVADLVQRKVALIVAIPFLPARAAMAATTTIPIVFEGGSDPVAAGLVASLSRPGGNVTGVSNLGVGLIAKHFEIMHELVPGAKAIAVLLNPNVQANFATSLKESQTAAAALGIELQILQAGTASEIDSASSAMATKHVGALIVSTDPLFIGWRNRIAALAAQDVVPSIHAVREFAVAGGLIAYGSQLSDAYRLTGVYAGRILSGERAADLPVQQAVRVELVINLKTAKAMGLTVPPTLLARADEVIE